MNTTAYQWITMIQLSVIVGLLIGSPVTQVKPPRVSGEPHDRLTRLCAVMTDALEADPESVDSDRAIIMLDDGTRGGITMHGYDDMRDGLVDLFTHIRYLCAAVGLNMDLLMIPDDVGDLDQ